MHGADAAQQVHPLRAGGGVAGVVQVQQHHVEVVLLQLPGDGGGGAGGLHLVSLALEQQAHGLQHVGLVVGHQHAGGFGGQGEGVHGRSRDTGPGMVHGSSPRRETPVARSSSATARRGAWRATASCRAASAHRIAAFSRSLRGATPTR